MKLPAGGKHAIDSWEEGNKHRDLISLRTLKKYNRYLVAQEGRICERRSIYLIIIGGMARRYMSNMIIESRLKDTGRETQLVLLFPAIEQPTLPYLGVLEDFAIE